MVKQAVINETAATAEQEPAVRGAAGRGRPDRALVDAVGCGTEHRLHAGGDQRSPTTYSCRSPRHGRCSARSARTLSTTDSGVTVRDELKATLDGVTSAVLTMKHNLGQSILLTYTVSKKLVKVPQHANLLPHVALMRKTNRLGRNRKAQTPAPTPPPATHV